MATSEPTLVRRPEQPYAAIYGVVTMKTIPLIAGRLPEVFGWLAERGIPPAGPPFLRYNAIGRAPSPLPHSCSGGVPAAHLARCGTSEAAGSVAVKRLR